MFSPLVGVVWPELSWRGCQEEPLGSSADVCGASSAVHISDMEPKTRYRAARHQCLKIDQPQLVQVIELAFRSLRPEDKLWTMSGSTLSARFDKILGAL